MALIIEDGSVIANANAYVTVAEVRASASLDGSVLPADDAAVEILIIKGMRWFELQEEDMMGSRVSPDQTLAFPRKGITLYGFPIADDVIPTLVKNVVIQASITQNAINLLPDYAGTSKGELQAQKVGPISRTFFKDTDRLNRYPMLMALSGMIDPLLTSGFSSGRLNVVRV